MIGLSGIVLVLAVNGAAASPSKGDVWREIYTDPEAFAVADINHDGEISDYEFGRYYDLKKDKQRPSRPRRSGSVTDTNHDSAFTPDELYPEARRFDRDDFENEDRGPVDYGNPYDE